MSRQDYCTPPAFLEAVKRMLGISTFTFDFAADATNAVAASYYSKEQDALRHVWRVRVRNTDWGWCNPPFADIEPWAKKCVELKTSGGQVALLVPASVGSLWFERFVHEEAWVLFFRPRLCFDPTHPRWAYPKDLILALYSPEYTEGYDTWHWKKP